MSSTFSNLKFELIANGEQTGAWGTTTNNNIGTAIEQAIVGMATLVAGDFTANVATLTLSNTNAAQNARALCLNIDAGAVSAAGTVNVPAIQKPYIIINGSSYTVTVKVSGQPGVAVPAGKRTVVYNNGTDVGEQVNFLTSLVLGTDLAITEGGTGASDAAGARTNLGLGTMATQAASAVAITGGSITGITDLAVADGGTGASDAAGARTNLGLGTMATQAASSVSITGGSITGITDLAVADGGTGASSLAAAGIATYAGAETLSNKNIQARVVVIADGASITINADTTDIATQANTQSAGTLALNAPTGTPFEGQKLMLRLRSTNAQTFSWNVIFAGSTDVPLPTTSSGASKYDYVGFIYNSTAAKWQLVAKNFGF